MEVGHQWLWRYGIYVYGASMALEHLRLLGIYGLGKFLAMENYGRGVTIFVKASMDLR